jgi:hypothetical protein
VHACTDHADGTVHGLRDVTTLTSQTRGRTTDDVDDAPASPATLSAPCTLARGPWSLVPARAWEWATAESETRARPDADRTRPTAIENRTPRGVVLTRGEVPAAARSWGLCFLMSNERDTRVADNCPAGDHTGERPASRGHQRPDHGARVHARLESDDENESDSESEPPESGVRERRRYVADTLSELILMQRDDERRGEKVRERERAAARASRAGDQGGRGRGGSAKGGQRAKAHARGCCFLRGNGLHCRIESYPTSYQRTEPVLTSVFTLHGRVAVRCLVALRAAHESEQSLRCA